MQNHLAVTSLQHLFLFVVFFVLVIYCSYIGDDDVVYKYMGRKPTSQEGLARIRFVLVKTFASLFGGVALSTIIGVLILKEKFGFSFSKNQGVYMVLTFMFVMYLFIGIVQNWIRRSQGRQQRPLIDGAVWKYNFR